ELVLHPDAGPRQAVQQCRLAGVRVAHDGDRVQLRAAAPRSLLVTLSPHVLQLLLQVAQALSNPTPLDLDLSLTGAAAGADAAHLAVVVVGADEARKQVVELRRLDLEAALSGARVLREDVEDQLGPIDDPRPQLPLEVALLPRAQVLVADQEVVLQLAAPLSELGHL